MAVSILIITHANIGHELINTAKTMFSKLPLKCKSITVPTDCEPDDVASKADALVTQLNNGDGVLILTDMFGSTPSNICSRIGESDNTSVVAGVNLPMLVRILNYPELPLSELTEKALSGGHDGIIHCEK